MFTFFILRVIIFLESKLFLFDLFYMDVFADILACCFYSFYLVIMVLLSVKSAVGSPPLTRPLPICLFKYASSLFLYEQFSMSPSLCTI